MSMNILATHANTMLDVLVGVFAAGGTLELRTGARPTDVSDPDSGTLLATYTIPAPGFSAASLGQIGAREAPWLAIATATGVVGHGRFKDSLGNAIADVVCGGGVPGDTTEDVTDTLTTLTPHGLVENQAFQIQQGTTTNGIFYAHVIDPTTINLLDAPGGSVLPMPGTPLSGFYLKDPAVTILIATAGGTLTTGDTVPLFDFGLTL